MKIYNRLKSAYKDFPVGERTVWSYVRAKKREINSEIGYIKLSHPGGEAQVAFGQSDFLENWKTVKLSFLVKTYPHSNGAYMQVFKGENLIPRTRTSGGVAESNRLQSRDTGRIVPKDHRA